MPSNSYIKGKSYENFIRRAHNTNDTTKHGAHQSFMSNLIDTEAGVSPVFKQSTFPKQLEKVKTYLIKAIDKFLKKKLTEDETMKLNMLKNRTQQAYSASELLSVVEQGLELTQRFK